jgi:hypothetical protein
MHELEHVHTRRTAAARRHHHASARKTVSLSPLTTISTPPHHSACVTNVREPRASSPAESDGVAARSSTPHRAGRTGGDMPKAAGGGDATTLRVTGATRSCLRWLALQIHRLAGMPGRRASGRASSASSTGWLDVDDARPACSVRGCGLSPSPLDALAQLAARKA